MTPIAKVKNPEKKGHVKLSESKPGEMANKIIVGPFSRNDAGKKA